MSENATNANDAGIAEPLVAPCSSHCYGVAPYYDKDGITLYHGDSRELLPTMPTVDLVITDPPYGMNFQSNYRAKKHKRIANDDQLPLDLIWLAIHKAKAAAYVFCRWDNLAAMPQPKSVVVWVKNNSNSCRKSRLNLST